MKAQLLKTIKESQQYMLSVAELLPEKNYGSTLADGTWSFGELMHHIAYGLQWWEDNYIKNTKVEWAPPPYKASKKEVIGLLKTAFDSLTNSVSKASPSEKLVTGVWATLDHVTHHRGQAVVHLRKHGLTPPDYIGVDS
jgi:uncharacterized damage-inducible protein DinB